MTREAEAAKTLGHQEGDDRPADQPADREDQAVEAVGEHQTGNTQEGRGGHVVAGNRQAVLEAGDAAAASVEVSRRLGLGCRPLGDVQRAANEDGEHDDGRPVGGLLLGITQVGTGGDGATGNGQRQEAGKDFGEFGHLTSVPP